MDGVQERMVEVLSMHPFWCERISCVSECMLYVCVCGVQVHIVFACVGVCVCGSGSVRVRVCGHTAGHQARSFAHSLVR